MLTKISSNLEKFQGLTLAIASVGIMLSAMFWMHADLSQQIAENRQEIAAMRLEFRQEIATVRQEMAAMRLELRQDIQNLETEMRTELRSVESELRTELRSVESDLQRQIDHLADGQENMLTEIGRIQGYIGIVKADGPETTAN